jgi:hypothetical protein
MTPSNGDHRPEPRALGSVLIGETLSLREVGRRMGRGERMLTEVQRMGSALHPCKRPDSPEKPRFSFHEASDESCRRRSGSRFCPENPFQVIETLELSTFTGVALRCDHRTQEVHHRDVGPRIHKRYGCRATGKRQRKTVRKRQPIKTPGGVTPNPTGQVRRFQ